MYRIYFQFIINLFENDIKKSYFIVESIKFQQNYFNKLIKIYINRKLLIIKIGMLKQL